MQSIQIAGVEGFPVAEPHVHVWRSVFKPPPPPPALAEYKVCGVCGCEEQVNRGARDSH